MHGRLITAFLTILTAATTTFAGLPGLIEAAVRTAGVEGATIAVSVRDAGGLELASLDGDEAMIPASNMKLFTTGAALHVLGGDFDFVTRLSLHDDLLVVTGDGDPAFADPELLELMFLDGKTGIDVDQFIDIWVRSVVATAPERISEVIVDDRVFDRQLVHPTWPKDQLNRAYCAEVSGFNFHLNVIHFFPRPLAGAAPYVSDYRPKGPGLQLKNKATSNTGARARATVWVARKANTNDMTFYGNVRHAYRAPLQVTVHDPPFYFAGLLAERIEDAGIEVDGYRIARPDDIFTDGESVGPRITTSISTIVTRCNRDSENLYAEALLKRVGYQVTGDPGSWVNGSAIVRHVVHERLGSPGLTSQIIVADGSGLSRGNRITPSLTTAWLASFHDDEKLGDVFIESLAVGGENGTLRKRFKSVDLHGSTVQAKSGYINGVVCLSGFVTSPDGRRRAFSILVNDVGASDVPKAKTMQEKIVSLIATDMVPSTVTLGSDDQDE
jgi:D-alanyl-D-alanine carboxypeptidase/D-alanyl-D-alanine-endopeptidase (penicillin-binding protein 4)